MNVQPHILLIMFIYIYIYTKNWLDKDDQCCFPIYQGVTIVET